MKTIPKEINQLPVINVIDEFLIQVGEGEKTTFIQLNISDFMKNVIYTLLDPSFSETEEGSSWNLLDISATVSNDELIKEKIIKLAEELQIEKID
ncbi:MAG: hypothetical protein SPE36_10875 [Lactobacillus johnsonii]|nr:hypothetical protein [Lactobacillus johnsonii]